MSKRAVLYARVSKDDTKQERRNLDGQIELGEEYATEKNYTIIERLTEDDKGAKGDDINLPQLNRVREMANNQEFDVLVVREIDRLSRSLAKQLIVEQEMKRSGIEIDYVLGDYPDTPEGNFMRHMRATVAEYEREKINERVMRGRYSKVKSGSVMVAGCAPYGYTLKIDEHSRQHLEINEPEAKIVRQIFEAYLSGKSVRNIAERLTERQVPTWVDNRPGRSRNIGKKQGYGEWSLGGVRHILRNETYSGLWHYGKRKGRWGHEQRPREEQAFVEVPAIISREIWDATVQLRKKKKYVRTNSADYDYLLKGLATCDHCGYSIRQRTSRQNGKVYAYYRCNTYRKERIEICDRASIHYRADFVDPIIWDWIVSLLTKPDLLKQGLETFYAEKEQDAAPLRDRLNIVEKLITDESIKLDRLLELYLSGDFDKDILAARKSRLETKITALQQEETELQMLLADQAISRDQIDAVLQFGEEITKELTSQPTIEMKRYILNTIDLQVWLGMSEDGERYIRIQCGLGNNVLPLPTTATCSNWTP